jgi:hypothetical protein
MRVKGRHVQHWAYLPRRLDLPIQRGIVLHISLLYHLLHYSSSNSASSPCPSSHMLIPHPSSLISCTRALRDRGVG